MELLYPAAQFLFYFVIMRQLFARVGWFLDKIEGCGFTPGEANFCFAALLSTISGGGCLSRWANYICPGNKIMGQGIQPNFCSFGMHHKIQGWLLRRDFCPVIKLGVPAVESLSLWLEIGFSYWDCKGNCGHWVQIWRRVGLAGDPK